MIEEFTKTSTEIVKKTADRMIEPIWNRLSNPFIASFSISWIVWNWQAILFLIFSSQSIEDKFPYIDKTFYNWRIELWPELDLSYLVIICKCILLPLASSLAYMLLLPKADNFFDKKNEDALEIKNEKILKDEKERIRRKGELETQLAGIEEKIFNIKNKLSEGETVSSLKERINGLNDQLSNLNSENEKLRRDNLDQTNKIKVSHEEQLAQLNISINELSSRLSTVTEEREILRRESAGKTDEIKSILAEKNEIYRANKLNKDYSVGLIEKMLDNSRFTNPAYPIRFNEDFVNSPLEGDYRQRLENLFRENSKVFTLSTYEVTLEHDSVSEKNVSNVINAIMEIVGGKNRITHSGITTSFSFEGKSDINKEIFEKSLVEIPYIHSARLDEFTFSSN